MTQWLIGGTLGVLLSVTTVLAADSVAPSSDRPDGPKPKEAPADTPGTPEAKKKQDKDAKPQESAAPSPPEEKSRPDSPPAPPETQEPKQENGKRPVTSLNLTIKLALMADPALFPFEIEVEMDKHKAVLTGSVPTEEEKGKAAEVAGKVEGVESVVNKLALAPALRASVTKRLDDAIASLVKERLNKSETLKAVGFEVKSDHGVVALSGKTRFQVIALEAAEAARQVPGVRAVTTAQVQITGKD